MADPSLAVVVQCIGMPKLFWDTKNNDCRAASPPSKAPSTRRKESAVAKRITPSMKQFYDRVVPDRYGVDGPQMMRLLAPPRALIITGAKQPHTPARRARMRDRW